MSRSWCSPADSGLRKKSAVVVKRSESVVAERGMTPWDRVEDKKIKKKKKEASWLTPVSTPSFKGFQKTNSSEQNWKDKSRKRNGRGFTLRSTWKKDSQRPERNLVRWEVCVKQDSQLTSGGRSGPGCRSPGGCWVQTFTSLAFYSHLKYPLKSQRQKLVSYCSSTGKRTSNMSSSGELFHTKRWCWLSREVCVLWRSKMVAFRAKQHTLPVVSSWVSY